MEYFIPLPTHLPYGPFLLLVGVVQKYIFLKYIFRAFPIFLNLPLSSSFFFLVLDHQNASVIDIKYSELCRMHLPQTMSCIFKKY